MVWLAFLARKGQFRRWRSGLHEHNQEAGDQGPDKVDGDLVLAYLIDDIADGRALLASVTVTSLAVPVSEPSGCLWRGVCGGLERQPRRHGDRFGAGSCGSRGCRSGSRSRRRGLREPNATEESESSASKNGRKLFLVILSSPHPFCQIAFLDSIV